MRSTNGADNVAHSRHCDIVAMAGLIVPGLSLLSHLVTERADQVGVLFAEDGEVLFIELFA